MGDSLPTNRRYLNAIGAGLGAFSGFIGNFTNFGMSFRIPVSASAGLIISDIIWKAMDRPSDLKEGMFYNILLVKAIAVAILVGVGVLAASSLPMTETIYRAVLSLLSALVGYEIAPILLSVIPLP